MRRYSVIVLLTFSFVHDFCVADELKVDRVKEPGAVSIELFGCEEYSGNHLLVAGTNATARIIVKDYYPEEAVHYGPICGCEGSYYRDVTKFTHKITGLVLTGRAAGPMTETAIPGLMRMESTSTSADERIYYTAAKKDININSYSEGIEMFGFVKYDKMSEPSPVSYPGADHCYEITLEFKLPTGDGLHGQYYWTAAVAYTLDWRMYSKDLQSGAMTLYETWHEGCTGLPYSKELEDAGDFCELILLTNDTGRVFFDKDSTDDGKNPNWFVYWNKDGAVPQLAEAGYSKVPIFDSVFARGGEVSISNVVDLQYSDTRGHFDPNTGKVVLHMAAGDCHLYAYRPDPSKYVYERNKRIVPENIKRFWDDPIYGIYTVENVIAHESQHKKIKDEYKTEIGGRATWNNLMGELLFGVDWGELWFDTAKYVQEKFDSDLIYDTRTGCFGGKYYKIRVSNFCDANGKCQTRAWCDHLTDNMETTKYSAYRTSETNLDTFALGIHKHPSYKCYGDDEYLAMCAGYEANQRGHSRVCETNDWGFPGYQSWLPPPFQQCRATAESNLKFATAMLANEETEQSDDEGEMECVSLASELCESNTGAKYGGVKYLFTFDVTGTNKIEIIGLLSDMNSNVVARAMVRQEFTAATNSVALYFDGADIFESGKKGPYMLLGLVFREYDATDAYFLSAVSGFNLPNVECTYTDFVKDLTVDVDGYTWKYQLENEDAILKYELEYYGYKFGYLAVDPEPEGDVVVPAKLGGHSLVCIGDSAFYCCENLLTVTIPSSVTNLCENAFYSCTAITNLIFDGNAPMATEDSFHRMNENCVVTVREGTTGWDDDGNGLWNGFPIVYVSNEDPIPQIEDSATADDVAAALSGSKDDKLTANITNAVNYNAYRAWAETVKKSDGSAVAGAQAVKDSPNAWLSFAIGSQKLIDATPTNGQMKIDQFNPTSTAGSFDFTVSIDDVSVGSDATAENLKKVFGLEGGSTLKDMSSTNVNITFGTPSNGKVKFTAGPKNTKQSPFFMKVKMTP